jgi:hypothetical protein
MLERLSVLATPGAGAVTVSNGDGTVYPRLFLRFMPTPVVQDIP